jgi:DNA-binding transcriptional MerR regulator
MTDLLDIGVVAARSGMTASALRYYERQEIITSSDRKGLRRQYRADVLDTLAVVAICQRAGFTLADIRGSSQRADARSGRSSLSASATNYVHTLRK